MASRRIVFLDIDGTLVDHAQHLPDSAAAAVRAARAAGNLVYICTGRARSAIPGHVLDLGFDGVISAGGGYIEEGGRLVDVHTMTAADVATLVAFFGAHDLEYSLQGFDAVYPSRGLLARMRPTIDRIRDDVAAWTATGDPADARRAAQARERAQRLTETYRPRDAVPAEDVAKATYLGADPAASDVVAAGLPARFQVIPGSIPYLDTRAGEIGLRGVDKGTALETVMRRRGLERAASIALGDSGNDLEMLRAAGAGIAMGGSPATVVAAADEVTDAVGDDGVWNALARHGLVG